MAVLGIDGVNDKITFATLVNIRTGNEIKITDEGCGQCFEHIYAFYKWGRYKINAEQCSRRKNRFKCYDGN